MPTITVAADRNTVVLNSGWNNPTNAYGTTGDDSWASAVPAKNSTKTSDFGFPSAAIPADSVINAVRLVVEWRLSNTAPGGLVGLQGVGSTVDPGAEVTKSTTVEEQHIKTFANTPALAQLNTAGFVLARIRASRGNTNTFITGFLDFVRLEVDYTPPTTPKTASDSLVVADSTRTGFPSASHARTDALAISEASALLVPKSVSDALSISFEGGDRIGDVQVVLVQDDFSDNQAVGWVLPDIGDAYVVSDGTRVYKAGGKGVQLHDSTPLTQFGRVPANGVDVESSGVFSVNKLPTGAPFDFHIGVRSIDGSNFYRARIRVKTDATVWLELAKVIATVATPLGIDVQIGSGYVANQVWNYRVQALGSSPTTIRARSWPTTTGEPIVWHSAEDAAEIQFAAGGFAWRTFQNGVTNLPIEGHFDDSLGVLAESLQAVSASDSLVISDESVPTQTRIIVLDDFSTAGSPGLPASDVGGTATVNDSAKITATGGRAAFAHTAANQSLTARWAGSGSFQNHRWRGKLQISIDPSHNFDIHIAPRMIGASDYYRARLRLRTSDNHVLLIVQRVPSSGAVDLGTESDLGVYGTFGTDFWWFDVEVTGAAGAAARVQAKAWKDGTAEPGTYTKDETDTGYNPGAYPQTNDLRGPGHPGLRTFTNASATNFPTVLFDDLLDIEVVTEPAVNPETGSDTVAIGETGTILSTGIDENFVLVDSVASRAIHAADPLALADSAVAGVSYVRTDALVIADAKSDDRELGVADALSIVGESGVAGAAILGEEFIELADSVSRLDLSIVVSSIASGEAVGQPTLIPAGVAIIPSAITSAESVGTPSLRGLAQIIPSAVDSAESVGTPSLRGLARIIPTAINSAESVGAPVLSGQAAILPTAIASAESVGTPSLAVPGVAVQPTSIASAESFGSPTLLLAVVSIGPTAIGPEDAYGTPGLLLSVITISPTAIASGEAVGNPSLVAAAAISPVSIDSAEAVGTPSLILSVVVISPTAIDSEEAVGNPTFAFVGAILPETIASEEAFGTPSLIPSVVVIAPTSIGSDEASGNPTLVPTAAILPSAVDSAEAFGTPSLIATAIILPSSIDSEELVGAPALISVSGGILPESIESGEVFGTPTLIPSLRFIEPTAIDSEELVSNPTLIPVASVLPSAIPSDEAFGTPSLVTSAQVLPTAIPSAESVGTPSLIATAVILPSSIGSDESVPIPTVISTQPILSPTSIPSEEAVGTPSLIAAAFILPGSIPSDESLGTPRLVAQAIAPQSISSEEALGLPTLIVSGVVISPESIASAEALGFPTLQFEKNTWQWTSQRQMATTRRGGWPSTQSGFGRTRRDEGDD